LKARPANGRNVDACKEMASRAAVLAAVDRSVNSSWELEDIDPWAASGISNLRAMKRSIFVNGMYLGRFGSTRRLLWAKIIRGQRPAIII